MCSVNSYKMFTADIPSICVKMCNPINVTVTLIIIFIIDLNHSDEKWVF